MKDKFINLPLKKNEEKSRFELDVDGHIAFIDYKETSSTVALIHTEAPSELARAFFASSKNVPTLFRYSRISFLSFSVLLTSYIVRHLKTVQGIEAV